MFLCWPSAFSFLRFTNTLLLLVGLGALGGAGYLVQRQQDQHGAGSALGSWAGPVLLAAGALTVLFSLVGLCAAGFKSRCGLQLYFGLTLVAYSIELVACTACFVALPQVRRCALLVGDKRRSEHVSVDSHIHAGKRFLPLPLLLCLLLPSVG